MSTPATCPGTSGELLDPFILPSALDDDDDGPGTVGVNGSIFGRNDELMSPIPIKKSSVGRLI